MILHYSKHIVNSREPVSNCEVGSIQSLVGSNIKTYRNRLGVTQQELAERSGLSQSFVADIERGHKFPSPDSIERLSDALQVRPYQLFLAPRDLLDHSSGAGLREHLSQLKSDLSSVIDRSLVPFSEGEDR